MAADQRGLALVTVLFVLALLMALALTLTDKVWETSRALNRDSLHERTFWAANAGIEWARRELAARYQASGHWQTLLPATAGAYAAAPVWTTVIGSVPVELFVRDNPDGDDDPQRDNDLKVLVLARARRGAGPEVLIESLCGFATEAVPTAYAGGDRNALIRTDLAPVMAEPSATFPGTD